MYPSTIPLVNFLDETFFGCLHRKRLESTSIKVLKCPGLGLFSSLRNLGVRVPVLCRIYLELLS